MSEDFGMPVQMSESAYKTAKRDCEGICNCCHAWSWGTAEPEATNVYCTECENRAVVGISAAKKMGLIEII